MTTQATICVGTLGQGIWRSSDGGATWLRVRHGLYSESAVRALAVHPSDARIMYCGAMRALPNRTSGSRHPRWFVPIASASTEGQLLGTQRPSATV